MPQLFSPFHLQRILITTLSNLFYIKVNSFQTFIYLYRFCNSFPNSIFKHFQISKLVISTMRNFYLVFSQAVGLRLCEDHGSKPGMEETKQVISMDFDFSNKLVSTWLWGRSIQKSSTLIKDNQNATLIKLAPLGILFLMSSFLEAPIHSPWIHALHESHLDGCSLICDFFQSFFSKSFYLNSSNILSVGRQWPQCQLLFL